MARPARKPTKTIDEVLDEFLAEQEARWSPATYRKYETIVDLLKVYMERYWPGHDGEYDAVTRAGGELAAVGAAKRTFNVDFYIFDPGKAARRFLDALTEKARTGVAVKLVGRQVGRGVTAQRPAKDGLNDVVLSVAGESVQYATTRVRS